MVAKKNWRGGHFMTYYTNRWHAERHIVNTSLCYFKFMYSCWVSEWREGKRERQVMPPLVLLIKFALLIIDNFLSKFLFLSVGCQSPTSAGILVAKYIFYSSWWPNGCSLERCLSILIYTNSITQIISRSLLYLQTKSPTFPYGSQTPPPPPPPPRKNIQKCIKCIFLTYFGQY